MIGHKKLYVDGFSEITDLLKPYTDRVIHQFADEDIVDNSVYVLGRAQVNHNIDKVIQVVESGRALIILSNPTEGSETLKWQIATLKLDEYITQGRMLLIGGGDIESRFHHLQYESFLPKVFDIPENRALYQYTDDIFNVTHKPYKFLFLNGRFRPHRKYLLQSFKLSGLLDQAIWTNLDGSGKSHRYMRLIHNGVDLMLEPFAIKYLEPEYEVPRYRSNLAVTPQSSFAKADLFNNGNGFDWGEIYIHPTPYVDTYFSLVTETIFNYPYSFRTEKIWKPIAIGHPWIAVSNAGYYRDIRNLGFKTFNNIIDESFDTMTNDIDRVNRIRDIVEDLCRSESNLISFLAAARPVCEYNQKHLWNMRELVRQQFPEKFLQFMRYHGIGL
jgi:hypothetical protein